jgi:hypothetical protein
LIAVGLALFERAPVGGSVVAILLTLTLLRPQPALNSGEEWADDGLPEPEPAYSEEAA